MEVAVVPLVAGQRSVREKEWLEAFKTFGIWKGRWTKDHNETRTHSSGRTRKALRELLAAYVRSF